MINKNEILKHISNKDDKILFSKIIDQYNLSCRNFDITFTEFVPMLKYSEFLGYLKYNNLDTQILNFGGFEYAERTLVGFFPEYIEAENSSFPISILEIEYNLKYSKNLTHRDFLGSIMGLGIDRSKIGDILVEDGKSICFVHNDIVEYLNANLIKVASTNVNTKICDLQNYIIPEKEFEEKNIIVSSLRLDVVVAGAFNMSRNKISNFIKADKVFLNFQAENNISKIIKLGDIITLRGYGRIKVLEVVGNTRSDRIVLKIIKYN